MDGDATTTTAIAALAIRRRGRPNTRHRPDFVGRDDGQVGACRTEAPWQSAPRTRWNQRNDHSLGNNRSIFLFAQPHLCRHLFGHRTGMQSLAVAGVAIKFSRISIDCRLVVDIVAHGDGSLSLLADCGRRSVFASTIWQGMERLLSQDAAMGVKYSTVTRSCYTLSNNPLFYCHYSKELKEWCEQVSSVVVIILMRNGNGAATTAVLPMHVPASAWNCFAWNSLLLVLFVTVPVDSATSNADGGGAGHTTLLDILHSCSIQHFPNLRSSAQNVALEACATQSILQSSTLLVASS